MKLMAFIAALLLAGCASWGSWLDDVGKRPDPPVAMSDAQARELQQQAEGLRAQAETVRLQLSHEGDRHRRFDLYRQLRGLGEQLALAERALYNAHRPSSPATAQPGAAR